MKNKYYKITLFISIFTLLLAFLVIPSFADDFNGVLSAGDNITFSENLNFSFRPYETLFVFSTSEDLATIYDDFQFSYPGRNVLSYRNANTYEYVTVYDSASGGWLNDSYRHLKIVSGVVLSGDNLGFFSLNIEPGNANAGIYDALFDILVSTIYGDRVLTSFEINIATILATITCVICFALPFIVVLWLTKMFLTLGRNW